MRIKMLKTMAGPDITPRAAGTLYELSVDEAEDLVSAGLAEVIETEAKEPAYTTAILPEPDNAAIDFSSMTKDEIVAFAKGEGIQLNTSQIQSRKSQIIEHIQRIMNG
jgi:hypothetical protein